MIYAVSGRRKKTYFCSFEEKKIHSVVLVIHAKCYYKLFSCTALHAFACIRKVKNNARVLLGIFFFFKTKTLVHIRLFLFNCVFFTR